MTLHQDNSPDKLGQDPDLVLRRLLTVLRVSDPWLDDPGPSLEVGPFHLRKKEHFRLKGVLVEFSHRSSEGAYILTPDDGSAVIVRSGGRLLAEYMSGLVELIERRGQSDRQSYRQRLAEADVRFISENSTDHFLESAKRMKLYTEAFFEAERLHGSLSRSGPTTKGGRAERRDPPSNLAEVIANKANEIGDPSPPSWKTLLRYLPRATKDGHLRLVHAGDKRGLREQPDRLPHSLEEILSEVLRERLSRPDGDSVRSITKIVRDNVNIYNETHLSDRKLRAPCDRTIHRRISRIPGIELIKNQKSNRKNRLTYHVVGKIVRPAEPLLEAEFDWKFVPNWVYSEFIFRDTRKALIYRPWKGTLVDRFNSGILSHILTIAHPSRQQFFAFIRDLVKPLPVATRKELGRIAKPPQQGLIRSINLDRGSELIGDDGIESLADLGISIRPTGRASPWQKPYVESLHSAETEEFFSKLPGYVPKGSDEEPPTSIEGLLSDMEFARKLESYYYEYRWSKPLIDLPGSPKQILQEFLKSNPGWAPPMPSSIETLDRCLTIRIEVTATNRGIRFQNLHYNSNWVRDIRSDLQAHKKRNPLVKVLVRPHDLSAVYVEHPVTGEAKLVPSLMPNYTRGMDLFRHTRVEQAKRVVRRKNVEEDEAYMLRIYAALVDVAQRPWKKKRYSSRDAVFFLTAEAQSGEACPLDTEDKLANQLPHETEVVSQEAESFLDESDEVASEAMLSLSELKASAAAAAWELSTASFANDDVAPKMRKHGERR